MATLRTSNGFPMKRKPIDKRPKRSRTKRKPSNASVPEQFRKYLTPEFTQQLIEHMYKAKRAALQ